MRPIYLLIIFFITSSYASEFHGHGIYFEIPNGWHITENNSNNINDTKIVLTDNRSAIRIDIVDFPELGMLRNISSVKERSIEQIMMDYYVSGAFSPNKSALTKNIRSISSTDLVNPDGAGSNLGFGTDIWDPSFGNHENRGRGGEWIFVFSKKEYGTKFIGIHALFSGKYTAVDLSYNHDWVYPAPSVLIDLINSIKTTMTGIESNMWEFDAENPLNAV